MACMVTLNSQPPLAAYPQLPSDLSIDLRSDPLIVSGLRVGAGDYYIVAVRRGCLIRKQTEDRFERDSTGNADEFCPASYVV
jgi:hypothetical protein